MGRPKKKTLETEINELHMLEQTTLQDLKNLVLASPRGLYLRDLILILHTLNHPLDVISDELLINFNDLVKEQFNVSTT